MNTIHWQKVLARRVADICQEQKLLDATQCERLVEVWLQDIQKCSRPEVAGVIMDAKRILWDLAPIH